MTTRLVKEIYHSTVSQITLASRREGTKTLGETEELVRATPERA